MKKILLIDGHDRRTLSAVRSLGITNEFEIHVGSYRSINASRYSKYTNNFFKYTDPLSNENIFIKELIDYIKLKKINILQPMGDDLTEIIVNNQNLIKKYTNVLVPKKSTFEIARNKKLTLIEASKLGISIPNEYKFGDIIENKINFPVFFKPHRSSGSVGLEKIKNIEQAKTYPDRMNLTQDEFVIQEEIPDVGDHFQVNILFDQKSNYITSTVKKKIRQFPIHGGPSTFFKTVKNEELLQKAVILLETIKWVGPAEVEFMLDPRDKKYKLMEINPRLSATITLSTFSGIDFVYIISKILMKEPLPMINDYNENYYCQWFFPGDMLNFVVNEDRFRQKHGYFFKKPNNLIHMTYDSTDRKPYFFYLIALFISSININKLKKFILRK